MRGCAIDLALPAVMNGLMVFLAELRRRNVLRAAVLYLASAWLLVQIITQIGPVFELSPDLQRWVIVALAVGFPIWLAFAWFYELTPEGLKRESEIDRSQALARPDGRTLDFVIIGVLAVAVVLLLTDRLMSRSAPSAAVVTEAASPTPVQPPVSAPPEHSIAVLPFANMSDQQSNECFSDGISEELLGLLARIPQLQVTARTSSFAFKGKGLGIPEVARQLRVAYVLDGSVRKAGDRLRISVQLVNGATGVQRWSRTWDRSFDDVFAIQDEIAADVAAQLKLTLLDEPPKSLQTSPQAYANFLRAVQLGRLRTAQAYDQSDALLADALRIDPDYAPAWIVLASNASNRAFLGLLSSREGAARAREATLKALAVDPDHAPAHGRLGSIAMYFDNDLGAAARHYQRALELDPASTGTLNGCALLLSALGRLDEARAVAELILERDPVNIPAIANLGLYQRYSGRLDESAATFRKVLSLVPGRGNAHAQLGTVLLLKGDAPGALAQIEQETSEAWKMYSLVMVYHALGRKSESDRVLAEVIQRYEQTAPYNIAYVRAFRGEADQAFAWLDQAVDLGDAGIADVVAENLFETLHSDPRWLPFLRKIGKAPEQLAAIEFRAPLALRQGVSTASNNSGSP